MSSPPPEGDSDPRDAGSETPAAGNSVEEASDAVAESPGDRENPDRAEPPLAGGHSPELPSAGEPVAEAGVLAADPAAVGSEMLETADAVSGSEDVSGDQAVDDGQFGFPEGLWRRLAAHQPPGMPTRRVWRSPLRGPWLTSVLGFLLLISLPLVIVTGLLDWIAYGPQFHQSNPAHVGFLHLPYFDWPDHPAWLFQLTEGLHVVLGLVLVPVVLAKLWSVMPKLFVWPPARSVANLLERVSLIMIVGGIVFEMATGILNIQYDYIFGFSFYTAHYFGAWVFIIGFVVHVSLKLPTMVRSLRSRSLRAELHNSLADTRPEPPDPDGLVAAVTVEAHTQSSGSFWP